MSADSLGDFVASLARRIAQCRFTRDTALPAGCVTVVLLQTRSRMVAIP